MSFPLINGKIPTMEESYKMVRAEIQANEPPERWAEWLQVEKIGLEEKPKIEKLLKEVQARMGVFDRVGVIPHVIETLMGNETYMGIGNSTNKPELLFSPGITKILSDELLRGVLAHELAHYINGDTQRRAEYMEQHGGDADIKLLYPKIREQEYAADETAARFGYGKSLRDALKYLGSRNLEALAETFLDDGKGSHPTLRDRVKRLKFLKGVLERRRNMINVRGMTDKELERQVSGKPMYTLPALTEEFRRRRQRYKRNLKRYQKRFKQGAYGVQRKSQ